MSVIGVFTKGRPTGHADATSILKYIPRARVPWQPSRFGRENLDEGDLKTLWGRGRYRSGPGNYNSGYSTDKTKVLEDNTIQMIPKHELQKYMPDISLGPKALVTPVSLMSARGGHRVTHDLLHSYDPYIGRLQKPAVVDHDNITVEDPNRVGLNAATLDCRGRIYRWLRRGPFFPEDHYFRRSTRRAKDGSLPVSVHEVPLMKKIIRLARKGHLKAACEEYRRVTSIPPVDVYRALTAACVPDGKLADAIAIFEDGDSRLFYVARDGEVLHNLMRCAIAAEHRVRVMWVYNVMRGRYYENNLVRAEVDVIWRYRIATLALEFLLDHSAGEEARAVYAYLTEEQLVDGDLYVRAGKLMQEALKEGKTVQINQDVLSKVGLARNAEAIAPHVAAEVYQRYVEGLAAATPGSSWALRGALAPPPKDEAGAVAWLRACCPDIDPLSVMRLARFEDSTLDLMAKDQPRYVARAVDWLELMSPVHAQREEVPLSYLRKSKPSITNPNVRVAWLPERRPPAGQLLANEEGFRFHYEGDQTRLVSESFVYAGDTLQSRYLAQQPHHTEVNVARALYAEESEGHQQAQQQLGGEGEGLYRVGSGLHHQQQQLGAPARILHSSVMQDMRGSNMAAAAAAATATTAATGAAAAAGAEGGDSEEVESSEQPAAAAAAAAESLTPQRGTTSPSDENF